jgi:hypothetical protein
LAKRIIGTGVDIPDDVTIAEPAMSEPPPAVMVEAESRIDDARSHRSRAEATPRGRCAAELFRAEVSSPVLEEDDGEVEATHDPMG